MIYPILTNSNVETFNLRILKSYRSSEDLLCLEMTDLWGEKYRKNYKTETECIADMEYINRYFSQQASGSFFDNF